MENLVAKEGNLSHMGIMAQPMLYEIVPKLIADIERYFLMCVQNCIKEENRFDLYIQRNLESYKSEGFKLEEVATEINHSGHYVLTFHGDIKSSGLYHGGVRLIMEFLPEDEQTVIILKYCRKELCKLNIGNVRMSMLLIQLSKLRMQELEKHLSKNKL